MRNGFTDCRTCIHIRESEKKVLSVINRITGEPEVAVSYSCGFFGLPCPMLTLDCRYYKPTLREEDSDATD